MTYSDFKALVGELNTGSSLPTIIDSITKLVLGKMARLRLNDSFRTAEITVGSDTEFLMSTHLPDFLDFKLDPNRQGKTGPYYFQSDTAYFLDVVSKDRFAGSNIEGGVCCIDDGVFKVNFPSGVTAPDILYVPMFGKFLVLDEDGGTLKEKPESDGDAFIFNSVFDDALVEGVLLYLKRKELNDSEFMKATKEWNTTLRDLILYQ